MPYYPPDVSTAVDVSVGTTSSPTTTSASDVLIPEMTKAVTPRSSQTVLVVFTGTFNVQNGDDFEVSLYKDGAEITNTRQRMQFTGASGLLGLNPGSVGGASCATTALVTGLSVGVSYTFEARWKRLAGTARAYQSFRRLIVQEIT